MEDEKLSDKPNWNVLIWFFIALLVIVGLFSCKDTPSSYSSSGSTSSGNYGYSQGDADWLRSKGASPSETRAIENACGSACR